MVVPIFLQVIMEKIGQIGIIFYDENNRFLTARWLRA